MQSGPWRSRAFVSVAKGGDETDLLESALARAIDAARATWPELAVDDLAFVRYLAERTPEGGEPCAHVASLHVADLYLACACAAGDPRALASFERRYSGEIDVALSRTGTPQHVADEARQALRQRLFVIEDGKRGKIADYSGSGPLGGWLRVAVVRMASNLRRSERSRDAIEENAPPATIASYDPELLAIRRRFGDAFNGAFREAFMGLRPDERTMLRLFYVDALNIAKIGDLLGVSRATVGRMMIAARGQMMETTLLLLRERLRVSAEELESLLGVVRSKLEVSLGALLGDQAGAA
jgi:RNA polymerase sigma-70 factor (ECF subfamily)